MLFVAVITLCLIPSNTRADGVGDILTLLHTITSTLQGPICGALSEMRKLSKAVNDFRQQIIGPLALIGLLASGGIESRNVQEPLSVQRRTPDTGNREDISLARE
jgi:hypothetical protein